MAINQKELMNTFITLACSFNKDFGVQSSKLREIVEGLNKTAMEVKQMQTTTGMVRMAGAVTTGVGLVAAVVAAPFTGGLSLATAAGAAVAGGGVATVVGVNVTKKILENGRALEVESQGREFVKIVEPLKKKLEEINTTCEKMQLEKAKAKAQITLADMAVLSELQEKSKESVRVAATGMQWIDDLLTLMIDIFTVIPTTEKDNKLADGIIQSADQSQKIIDQFDQMKNELRKFLNPHF